MRGDKDGRGDVWLNVLTSVWKLPLYIQFFVVFLFVFLTGEKCVCVFFGYSPNILKIMLSTLNRSAPCRV